MDLLKYLESGGSSGFKRAATFFLAPGVEVKKNEVVSNFVMLVSAINARMVQIPPIYPKPLSGIVKLGFDSILQSGGSLKIRFPSEEDYIILEGQKRDDFIKKCDTLKFTVAEDGKNPDTLLVDVIQ